MMPNKTRYPVCESQLNAILHSIIPTIAHIIPERAIKTLLSTAGLNFSINGCMILKNPLPVIRFSLFDTEH